MLARTLKSGYVYGYVLLCGGYLSSVKGCYHLHYASWNAEAAVQSGYVLLCGDYLLF